MIPVAARLSARGALLSLQERERVAMLPKSASRKNSVRSEQNSTNEVEKSRKTYHKPTIEAHNLAECFTNLGDQTRETPWKRSGRF